MVKGDCQAARLDLIVPGERIPAVTRPTAIRPREARAN